MPLSARTDIPPFQHAPVGVCLTRSRAERVPATRPPGASRDSVVLGLAPGERHLLGLRLCDDLTQAEIAERTGVTQDQVSRLLRAFFSDLRAELGDVAAATSTSAEA